MVELLMAEYVEPEFAGCRLTRAESTSPAHRLGHLARDRRFQVRLREPYARFKFARPLNRTEREWSSRMRKHVEALAGAIGGRSLDQRCSLDQTLEYLAQICPLRFAEPLKAIPDAQQCAVARRADCTEGGAVLVLTRNFDEPLGVPPGCLSFYKRRFGSEH